MVDTVLFGFVGTTASASVTALCHASFPKPPFCFLAKEVASDWSDFAILRLTILRKASECPNDHYWLHDMTVGFGFSFFPARLCRGSCLELATEQPLHRIVEETTTVVNSSQQHWRHHDGTPRRVSSSSS